MKPEHACNLGLWPSSEYELLEVGLASGKTYGYLIPKPIQLELIDGNEVLSRIEVLPIIDPELEEPLITDATIDELGIQVISFKRGLWRTRMILQIRLEGVLLSCSYVAYDLRARSHVKTRGKKSNLAKLIEKAEEIKELKDLVHGLRIWGCTMFTHLAVVLLFYLVSICVMIYYLLWLFGFDLKYVYKYIIDSRLRYLRRNFITIANEILIDEFNRMGAFFTQCGNILLPRLIVDFRFEEVPGGRYIPPKYIFIQHTNNLERLRETIRHELIHHIHWHCLRHAIPWSKREEFTRKICRLLKKNYK